MMLAAPISPVVLLAPHRSRGLVIKLALLASSACIAVASTPVASRAQIVGLLTSRDELSAAAIQAEKSGNSAQSLAIRQRLRDGDFQVGDRIVLTVISDLPRIDTLVVRPGRLIDVPPGRSVLPLAGVLRSELKDLVTVEVFKYVKALEVKVTPLTRIAVLGEVAKPGYFALRSDIPISDAIMVAGGPTQSADFGRSFVRRGNRVLRSPQDTQQALTGGLTLDQFGFGPGDELVVGRQKAFISPYITALVGLTASVTGIWFVVKTTNRH